ncbi:MAG: SIS domain-containing protein, partial [Fastidiosipila sp.]|nr:SIS domain-containing protein [Fastidiosipila sp.]
MDIKETYMAILDEHRQVCEKLDEDSMHEFIETIKKYDRVFTAGVGREGLMTRAFAMRLMHTGREVHWIWDDTTPSIMPGDLLIATLGDGEIGHLDYVCRRAKEVGAYVLVITGSPSGITAVEVADQVLFIPAAVYRGKDKVVPSIQPMGNLFEQSLLLLADVTIMTLVDETPGLNLEEMGARHRN